MGNEAGTVEQAGKTLQGDWREKYRVQATRRGLKTPGGRETQCSQGSSVERWNGRSISVRTGRGNTIRRQARNIARSPTKRSPSIRGGAVGHDFRLRRASVHAVRLQQ